MNGTMFVSMKATETSANPQLAQVLREQAHVVVATESVGLGYLSYCQLWPSSLAPLSRECPQGKRRMSNNDKLDTTAQERG